MKKLVFGSLFGLALLAVPGKAQFGFGPLTNPQQGPMLNPFFPYYFGNPGAIPYGYGGGAFGANRLGPQGFGGGTLSTVMNAQISGAAVGATPDLTNPMVTGHATRFFDYSRYYFNQGGTVTTQGAPVNVMGTPIAPQSTQSIGIAPPRARTNPRTGS